MAGLMGAFPGTSERSLSVVSSCVVGSYECRHTFLLALLTNNGADTTDQRIISGNTKVLLYNLEGAKDDIGEGLSETNGLFKGLNTEGVLARLDCLLDTAAKLYQGAVGVEEVKFFLLRQCQSFGTMYIWEDTYCLDGLEGPNDEFGIKTVEGRRVCASNLIALDIVGDVLKKLGEEGNFSQLVEGDQLKAGQAVALWWWWDSSRKATTSSVVDVRKCCRSNSSGRAVGKAISKVGTIWIGLGWEWDILGIRGSIGRIRLVVVGPLLRLPMTVTTPHGFGGSESGGTKAKKKSVGMHYGIAIMS